MADAKASDVLFSIHLKATMMKVSDPILFGHAVKTYFADVFAKHADTFDRIGVNANDGLADVLTRVAALPDAERAAIEADVAAALATGPALAMVDSDRGITNLHVPSDIIIDASMPPMIRDSGKMWNAAGDLQDTLAVIPDSSYAGVYAAVVDDCRAHGAFDPATMGSVPNVGLMAQQAEEYGSHDKTFEIPADGTVRVVEPRRRRRDAARGRGRRRLAGVPGEGRAGPRLGRARGPPGPPHRRAHACSGSTRPARHDAQLIAKVRQYLPDHDTSGLTIEIMAPADACRYSLERIRRGEDTISVTGNVLRDYLTDLFPIMELGTSAKMLSIVPLMNGGGLFETGAGGSAPKHVQQFVKENHLRWDSLGEFLALAASLEFLAQTTDNATAQLLADTLDRATGSVLDENRSPSRKVHELDNRGSHFYLALYWAQELAAQTDDPELAARFAPIADALAANEEQIVAELNEVQGSPVDIGGYYFPDDEPGHRRHAPEPDLQRRHRRHLNSHPLGVRRRRSRRRAPNVLLAELNIRHTRRHMPTRRVAVDDGYLPTSGPAFGGVLIGAVIAEHVPGLDEEQLDALDRFVDGGPPRAHGAAHRAALPAPDRHPRARPLPPPHHQRGGGTGLGAAGPRARPPRPRRAAGDRRDHGRRRSCRRRAGRSRSGSSTPRSPDRACCPRDSTSAGSTKGSRGAPARARHRRRRSAAGRRNGRASRPSGGGRWRCSGSTPAWPSSATTCSAGSGGSSGSRTPTTARAAPARPSASPSSPRPASSCST